ncbi:exonuclease domain-containing protein [Yimella sp. cx-51]|uniref:exonuclease domain-containing protein n=1 Tax=Yimella sp. cx-51 TaxID=2770551 RepID=UPI00165DF613|nr:exonuclease domain-containing protein [Yimella sp. cx-51]MBC9957855.1 DNA polymerase III subunit epsilon [Yimella sp. cx-51]QTH37991.1 hypothetical protein J5M86_14355 [Yimella sp. cx-51]
MTTASPTSPFGDAIAARYPHSYAVLDVETSGLDPRRHRVLQVAITQLDAHGEVQQVWSSLVNPGVDPGPVDLHGLTAERLAGAPSYAQLATHVADLVRGRVVVAHNAGFDWAFLSSEGARVGIPLPTRERLCTVELTRTLRTPAATFSLESLCAHWQIPQARPHDAEDDVRVLVEVLRYALADAAAQQIALPIRDPYARITLRRKLRRRYRKTKWKLKRRWRNARR